MAFGNLSLSVVIYGCRVSDAPVYYSCRSRKLNVTFLVLLYPTTAVPQFAHRLGGFLLESPRLHLVHKIPPFRFLY